MAYQRTPYVESKRAEARERLVLAAVGLVERGGWREVQMSVLAGEAGLSTGAVYLHFASKTDLLAEVYRRQAGTELHVFKLIAEQPVPAADRLRAGIHAFAQRALKKPRLAYALAIEPTEIEVEEVRLQFHTAFIAQLKRILDDGAAAGEFALDDTEVAATCIFGGMVESLMNPPGIAVRGSPQAAPQRSRQAAWVDGVVEFCLRGVGRPAAPRHAAAPKARAKTRRAR
jgi:AcrR family transcriptional regulator